VRAPDLAACRRRPGGCSGGRGAQLGLPTLAATNVAIGVVAGAALLRESVGLGRMLYDALQGVARRARLHYAPSTRARPR
jgi:hypothetical protein